MKNIRLFLLITCTLFLYQTSVLYSQAANEAKILVKGKVIADENGKPLEYANVSINNTNISTVTNQDGFFSLRIPESDRNYQLVVEHLGYNNYVVPVITLIGNDDNTLRMVSGSIQLDEIEVVSGDGTDLVRKALRYIPDNYEDDPNMMVAFYREAVKKESKYLSLVEAVLDVYKASYQSYSDDQARIYIGRKATDISPKDTVFMKFQGGISNSLMLDIAKNPEIVFGEEAEGYKFNIDGIITMDNRPHYVIDFSPYTSIDRILFRGKIYLDVESLAFKRMEFNMNVEDRKDATSIFIKRKPRKMRVSVENARYVVNYAQRDGKWYFNYSSTQVDFNVRFTKYSFLGLFTSTYTIYSEMAITDRYEDNVHKFPRKERVRSTDVIAEKVANFQDVDFWGDYTVIEPDKEINDAIERLSDKLMRRE